MKAPEKRTWRWIQILGQQNPCPMKKYRCAPVAAVLVAVAVAPPAPCVLLVAALGSFPLETEESHQKLSLNEPPTRHPSSWSFLQKCWQRFLLQLKKMTIERNAHSSNDSRRWWWLRWKSLRSWRSACSCSSALGSERQGMLATMLVVDNPPCSDLRLVFC